MKKPLWLNKEKLSSWALKYCLKYGSDDEIKRFITDELHALDYCYRVDDDPYIREKIITRRGARIYCNHVSGQDIRLTKIAKRLDHE